MGNELSTQVVNTLGSKVSSAPQTQPQNTGFNGVTGMPNSLFNVPKDYSNDFIMPEFLKTGNITDEQRASVFKTPYNQSAQPQQTQPSLPTTQDLQLPASNSYAPAFGNHEQVEQAQMTPEQISEYYEKLLAQNPNLRITEKGNIYEVSHTGKKIAILAGIGTALAGGIKKICTGTALKDAFNLKSLAVKLPVFAVAGWAVGSLIDAFINSQKAQQADEKL